MATEHYSILRAEGLLNERQLEVMLEDGWILLQIVPVGDNEYYIYFYRN
jgi:hypothetical protein